MFDLMSKVLDLHLDGFVALIGRLTCYDCHFKTIARGLFRDCALAKTDCFD
jgi:hypothetical protein